MAISTYTGLKDAIRRWSKRLDATDAFMDDFIDLCEEKIYANEIEPLRIKEMDTRSTATVLTTSRFIALPTDFVQMRRLKINAQTTTVPGPSRDTDVRYAAPDQIILSDQTGQPSFFTTTSQLGFERIPDRAYTIEMQFWAKETALSDANTTNAVLTNYPSIYMMGSLWALWDYYSEPQMSADYYNKFLGAIKGANKVEKNGRYGPTPQIRSERVRP